VPRLLHRIGLFIKGLFHHWWFLLFLILSFGSTVATYLPAYLPHFQIPRPLPLAVAFLAFIVATFRVFCDQLDAQDELTAECKKYEQNLTELRGAAESNEMKHREDAQELENLRKVAAALMEEVARLQPNPVEEQRLRLARKMLSELSWIERDLVRFLLLSGDSRIDVIFRAMNRSWQGSTDIGILCQGPVNKGLLTRVDDHMSGYATISIKPTWREILPAVLLPRDEEDKPPFFDGIADAS